MSGAIISGTSRACRLVAVFRGPGLKHRNQCNAGDYGKRRQGRGSWAPRQTPLRTQRQQAARRMRSCLSQAVLAPRPLLPPAPTPGQICHSHWHLLLLLSRNSPPAPLVSPPSHPAPRKPPHARTHWSPAPLPLRSPPHPPPLLGPLQTLALPRTHPYSCLLYRHPTLNTPRS